MQGAVLGAGAARCARAAPSRRRPTTVAMAAPARARRPPRRRSRPPAPRTAAPRRRRRRRQARLGVAGEGKIVGDVLRDRQPEGHRHRGQRGRSRWSRAPRARSSTRAAGLRGYGKLIIIKHNKTYLSAYAHNRDILVKEGAAGRRKGQKIAEMGNTDADRGEAALRDPPAGQADGSRALPAARMKRPRLRRRAAWSHGAARPRRAGRCRATTAAGARPLLGRAAARRAARGAVGRLRHRRHAALSQRRRPARAAHAGRGAALRARDARRRLRGAADDDRAQPAARRQHRAPLHASRPRAARPDRGRQPRPHPRAREVRSRSAASASRPTRRGGSGSRSSARS